jgi:hypothetical protein
LREQLIDGTADCFGCPLNEVIAHLDSPLV